MASGEKVTSAFAPDLDEMRAPGARVTVNPRAYLHRVVHCIVHGWPQAKLRDLLPDRMLAEHPELYVGDPDALPMPALMRALPR